MVLISSDEFDEKVEGEEILSREKHGCRVDYVLVDWQTFSGDSYYSLNCEMC